MTRHRLLAALLLALATTHAGAARADRSTAQSAFEAAERADRELRFAEALARYREAAAADPSASFADVASARARYLETHDEAGFEPLIELERARREPALLQDAARLASFDRDAARSPKGLVRAESFIVAGEAWLRLGDAERAEHDFAEAADDPSADDLTRAIALGDLVGSLRSHGGEVRAIAALDAHPTVLPALRAEVSAALLRSRLTALAASIVVAFAAASAFAAARVAASSGLRALRGVVAAPLPIGAALLVGAAGAIATTRRSGGDPRPFLLLGAALAAIVVASRGLALASSATAPSRLARAFAAALAAIAAGYLATLPLS